MNATNRQDLPAAARCTGERKDRSTGDVIGQCSALVSPRYAPPTARGDARYQCSDHRPKWREPGSSDQ